MPTLCWSSTGVLPFILHCNSATVRKLKPCSHYATFRVLDYVTPCYPLGSLEFPRLIDDGSVRSKLWLSINRRSRLLYFASNNICRGRNEGVWCLSLQTWMLSKQLSHPDPGNATQNQLVTGLKLIGLKSWRMKRASFLLVGAYLQKQYLSFK